MRKSCTRPEWSNTATVPYRASAVHNLLQDGIEVEVVGDAGTGFVQPGEAVPQRLWLSSQVVGFLH